MAEEMKIEIIRRETLKPSSPTPNNLKHYKLSLLDQLVRPNVYPSQIFFYPNNHDFPTSQWLLVLNKLKESLSKALTRFYPLAGRIKGNVSIDCRDDGAPFIEARIHGFLSTFLRNLDNDKLPEPLLPPKSEFSKRLAPPLLLVQATFFDCGGLAVGLYMCHKFGDGGTLSRFMKDWSFLSHGGHSQTLLPALEFTASSSFAPAVSAVQTTSDESKRFAVSGEKCVTKRFVFDVAKIAALKAKAASTWQWRRQPTRAEAITALVWRCGMSAARRTNRGFPMHFVMHQLVNFRKRIEPAFSENSIGNFVQYFSVEIDNQERKTMELSDLVAQLRKGIEGFDEGEAKRLGGDHGDAAEEIFKSWKERKDLSIRDDLKLFTCTSALDFGFYEIDFGWGKPIWVTLDAGSSLNNFIVLTKTRDGDGVEAWVTLSEEDMALFELDPELLSFASLSNQRVLLLPESRGGSLSKL